MAGRPTSVVAVAAVAVVAGTVVEVGRNVPGGAPPGLGELLAAVGALAALATVAAWLTVGLSTPATLPLARVGALAGGVFGAIALVVDAAVLPALVAVPTGAALALLERERTHRTDRDRRRSGRRCRRDRRRRRLATAGLAAVLVGLVWSVAAVVAGAVPGGRAAGASIVLLGVGALPLGAGARLPSWVAGAVAGAVVLAAGVQAPFVTGAVAVVAGNLGAVPLPVVAVGVGGVVATAAAGVRRRDPALVAGSALLVGAGVPAALGSVLATGLGVVVLARVMS